MLEAYQLAAFLLLMEHTKTTPKDFFLWAGAMIALYGGVVAFIALVFDYIDYTFPDPLSYYADPYSSISYEMAALIVLAPLFLVLMRLIRRDIAADASRAQVWVRRWALFLTIFIAGATIVIDLITLLTTFLSGEELTAAFLLKVLVVLVVAGAGLVHFLADIRGYWQRNPAYARYVTWGVGLVVALAVVSGFFIVGSPQTAREYRTDETRVSDLQSIQYQLANYYQLKRTLPQELATLNDPLSYYTVPADPTTGAPYRYEKIDDRSFRLCATFVRESRPNQYRNPASAVSPIEKGGADTWEHGAGEACFERTIDPELYPPITR